MILERENLRQLVERIERAKAEVDAAEGQLEQVLRELTVAPRAEKTTVSRGVESAFSKLRAVKSDLDVLEKMLAEEG